MSLSIQNFYPLILKKYPLQFDVEIIHLNIKENNMVIQKVCKERWFSVDGV